MSSPLTAVISSSRAGAGSAPAWRKTMIPSRKAISVGMAVTWAAWASACSASVSMLPNTTSSCRSDAAS